MAAAVPEPARCNTAIKLLEQFERLARKFGIAIPPKKLMDLRNRRSKETIRSSDLPAKLRSQFPGEFAGKSLKTIRDLCKKRKGG
jgi:hypothetical protein